MEIDKKRLKDEGGRLITQSLFLEYQYNVDLAMYTIDEDDKTYKGVVYPSLKRLYLECEDPHEYTFAKTYLASWEHWQRLLHNKWCRTQIDLWREELQVAIASNGMQNILDLATEGNFQAAKYVADRQWSKKPGRPSKAEAESNKRIEEKIDNEFDEDLKRMNNVVGLNKK